MAVSHLSGDASVFVINQNCNFGAVSVLAGDSAIVKAPVEKRDARFLKT